MLITYIIILFVYVGEKNYLCIIVRWWDGGLLENLGNSNHRFESCPDYKTHITNKNVIYFEIANYKPT